MDWREFDGIERGYKAARQLLRELLERDDELFQRTQPGAIRYDQDKVQSSGGEDKLLAYVAQRQAEHLDERIRIARIHVEEWVDYRTRALQELRRSRKSEDRIYVLRFVDNLPVWKVASMTNYSKSQVYNIMNRMNKVRRRNKKTGK